MQRFLGMLPGGSEDSDQPVRTLECLSSAGTNYMGLAVRLCESLFHFCQYDIGFVILPKNMTVINVVPAGTDIKLFVLGTTSIPTFVTQNGQWPFLI